MAPRYVLAAWILFHSSLITHQRTGSIHSNKALADKNINDICNVIRKPGRKKQNGMPDKGQQISVITQENLKLAAFSFHQIWRCTFDWEAMGVYDDNVCLLSEQMRYDDDYKDPFMLHRINKTDMPGMIKTIKEKLRSHQCVVKSSSSINHQENHSPDNDMITRMSHLPPDENKLLLEHNIHSVKEHIEEYDVDNRTVYDRSDLQGYISVSICQTA